MKPKEAILRKAFEQVTGSIKYYEQWKANGNDSDIALKAIELALTSKEVRPLDQIITRMQSAGWFVGKLEFNLKIENAFEGFYGRASETWETRITMECNEVKGGDKIIIPAIKIVGERSDNTNNVAKKFLNQLTDENNRQTKAAKGDI